MGFLLSPLPPKSSSFHESKNGNQCAPRGYNPYISASSIELQQHHQPQQPRNSGGTNKKRLQKQAKSLGHQYEFKTVALSSDLSRVQERLAVLDKKADIELESVSSESSNTTAPSIGLEKSKKHQSSSHRHHILHQQHHYQSPPPALPPRDYFTNNEDDIV